MLGHGGPRPQGHTATAKRNAAPEQAETGRRRVRIRAAGPPPRPRPASSRRLARDPKMSLSEKSNSEISKLLGEYGIKHGPVVDSTRNLYEKKLEVAMEKAAVVPSPDKTFYREEEEITYITYHSPVRQESDMLKRRGNIEPDEDEESGQETESPVANRTANHGAGRSGPLDTPPGGRAWKLIRLLLLLAVLAAALYYAYCRRQEEEGPFNVQ
uniref:emerin (Emery-Dreifuss muscular dystrophy) isoform X2 n=1 Tax=Gasterosteus aculeatus aculeatus TaxID=481459 RepID=UPI001A99390B|nr:emerin (Emery-Dreifuss muscular dystrophy) isoform X2 [Gasterosteus aculeatus aculeatus]